MMKRVLVILLIVSLLALCGCGTSGQKLDPTNAPTNSGATEPGASDATTGNQSTVTDPAIDWETPIDIDDSFTEPEGDEVTEPAATNPTEPSDENDPTEAQDPSEPTKPQVTEPQPTDPKPTTPPATGGSNGKGPIELPMIPG